MESDKALRRFKERRQRIYEGLEEIRRQTDLVLQEWGHREPTLADAVKLDRLRERPKKLLDDYMREAAGLLEHVQAIIEANRRRDMTEHHQARSPRNQAKIEQLSEGLSTNLRLERVDDAIKELLAFLSDEEFFVANATAGRRRRLRSLQNSIGAALNRH